MDGIVAQRIESLSFLFEGIRSFSFERNTGELQIALRKETCDGIAQIVFTEFI